MQLTSPPRTNGLSPVSWRFVWIGLALLLATWPVAALSQTPFPADPYAREAPDSLLFEEFSGQSGQALGGVVRGGFITGPGVGRENSFAPLEFMPYFFLEDGMLFGDLRGFRSVEDGFGANVGLGYRQYLRKWDRIVGVNFYYDYDNTSGQLFRQTGIGLETLGEMWDMRLNTYFPVTENTKELSLSDPFNIRFNGNNILFDQIRTFGVHLKGLDHELGMPLPGRIMERHNVKGVAGWYHFQQTGVENTWGWKGRIEGDLTAHIHMGLEVTNDNTFDTNVVLSVGMSYGGFRQPEGQARSQFDRMTAPVQRQYTAVVQKDPRLEEAVIALRPDGTPYFVEHVASVDPYDRANLALMARLAPQFDPTAVLGSFENPYLTIADAQAPTTPLSDITFVWANSRYANVSETILTESGNRLLGESDNAPHTFLVNGRVALLPRAVDTAFVDAKPLFTFNQSVPGIDGVTLSSGLVLPGGGVQLTEFSGFSLGDELTPGTGTTGNGIRAVGGQNVTGVQVNYNDVNYSLQDGVLLEQVGLVNFLGNRIFNAGEDGFHVDGGVSRINFFRDPNTSDLVRLEIQNDDNVTPNGVAIHIENMQAGSFINMAGFSPSRVDYRNAGGVLVENSTGGSAQFGAINVFNSPAVNANAVPSAAIDLINNGGNYTFFSPITILNPQGDGINVETQLGTVGFLDPITITNRNARGIDLLRNDGNVFFNGTVDINQTQIGGGVTSNSAAVEYQQSTGDVTFRNILTIAGGNGDGILIGQLNTADPTRDSNNFGRFTNTSNTRITGINGVSIHILEDDSEVTFRGDVAIANRGGTGIRIDRQRDSVSFTGTTGIDNQNNALATAVQILGTNVFVDPNNLREVNGDIFFSTLTIDNALPTLLGVGVSGVEVRDVQAPVTISELNIDSSLGTALFARNAGDPYTNLGNGRLVVGRGEIDAEDGAAIDIQDSRVNLAFTRVSSSDSPIQGIRMVNNASALGGFALVVDPAPNTDGGIIADAALQGALFQNTGRIRLNFMEFDDNGGNGVLVANQEGDVLVNGTLVSIGRFNDAIYTNEFQMDNALVTDNGFEGLLAFDIPIISMNGGQFDGNGGATIASEISLVTTQELINLNDRTTDDDDVELSYQFTIIDVSATEAGIGADAMEIGIPAAGADGTPQIELTMLGTDYTRAVLTLEDAAALAGVRPTALLLTADGQLTATIDGYTFITQRSASSAVTIESESNADTATVAFTNNIVQLEAGADSSFGLEVITAGFADFIVLDNVFQLDAGSTSSTALRMDFNNTAVVTVGGRNDNIYPLGIPDDANFANPDQPFGNLFIMNSTLSRAIDLDFARTSTATIENNLIDNTQGTFVGNVDGIVLTVRESLTLNGGLDNLIFRDISFLDFNNNLQFLFGQQGSGPDWFILNGAGVVNGSILVNGVPQP